MSQVMRLGHGGGIGVGSGRVGSVAGEGWARDLDVGVVGRR